MKCKNDIINYPFAVQKSGDLLAFLWVCVDWQRENAAKVASSCCKREDCNLMLFCTFKSFQFHKTRNHIRSARHPSSFS